MGTEQFTKIVPQNGMAPGTTHVHALRGDPVSGVGLVNNPGLRPGIEQAGLFSTAPYVDPSIARKAKLAQQDERKGHCRAKGNTCKGWANGDDGLCLGHRKSLAKGKDIGI
jgi:hypothetical protein